MQVTCLMAANAVYISDKRNLKVKANVVVSGCTVYATVLSLIKFYVIICYMIRGWYASYGLRCTSHQLTTWSQCTVLLMITLVEIRRWLFDPLQSMHNVIFGDTKDTHTPCFYHICAQFGR